MRILGISAFYQDSAAALIEDGKIITAAQEERFTRVKHDPSFPIHAIEYCLEEQSITTEQLDAIIFYDKPLLTFERLLETYYAFAPKGLVSFIKTMPVWLGEKLFLKQTMRKKLKAAGFKKLPQILFSEHHLSHAASAFYPSGFKKAAILTVDGVGEWATATIGYGMDQQIKILKELRFPHSIGLLYSSFTYFLGFKVNSGEYKMMGLAPYGNENDAETKRFESLIHEKLIDLKEDGSLLLHQEYFSYATHLRMVPDKKWESLFGLPRREPEKEILQIHCNLALAIQNVTEEVVLKMAAEAKRVTGADRLCMAGGVALNCVINGKLKKKGWFEQVFIQPASGDAGGALGSALAAYHLFFEKERNITIEDDTMQGSYLGPEATPKQIKKVLNQYGAEAHYYTYDDLYPWLASQLDMGKIVGWIQGRMEFGPRALGGRSILADPRKLYMQKN